MANRLVPRIGRRKRSHQVGEAAKIIPINHETAEIMAQQKKLFREQFGREPGPDDPLFFDAGVAAPQFLSDESTHEIWKVLLQAAIIPELSPRAALSKVVTLKRFRPLMQISKTLQTRLLQRLRF